MLLSLIEDIVLFRFHDHSVRPSLEASVALSSTYHEKQNSKIPSRFTVFDMYKVGKNNRRNEVC